MVTEGPTVLAVPRQPVSARSRERQEDDASRPIEERAQVREELARRFREDHGSFDPEDRDRANVYPYFIGVFDTVAALGNPVTTTLFALASAGIKLSAVPTLISPGSEKKKPEV